MEQDRMINRRQFLTISSGLLTGAFIPAPVFGYLKSSIVKKVPTKEVKAFAPSEKDLIQFFKKHNCFL